MAHQNIVMRKIGISNSFIYYHVNDYANNFIFFIAIDKEEKIIKYYLNDNFAAEPIETIGFSDPSQKIGTIIGIENQTAIRTSFMAYKAYLNNNFPEVMSYVSS